MTSKVIFLFYFVNMVWHRSLCCLLYMLKLLDCHFLAYICNPFYLPWMIAL